MQPSVVWTEGPTWEAPDEGLHNAFARVVRAHPHRTALAASERALSYSELNRRAELWAHHLETAGVTPGDFVPIVLPRSAELVVAILSVLKLGAAYVLLDPRWPAARQEAVVRQLHAPLVIALAGRGSEHGPPVWSPDPAADSALIGERRRVRVSRDDACCVFFTSGTTGPPKGVVSSHRATARLFTPGTFARFDTGTVIPLAAAMPWDAFSLELWSALLTGGTSVLIDEDFLTASSLRDAISRFGVTTVWLTSSLFNVIVDEDLDAVQGLTQVLIGGERLSVPHVRRFIERYPDIALINGYGPVETTVFATTHQITSSDCDRPQGVPLGQPVPGTSVFVLDGSRPCAVGETGEICVAGDGLAHHYLGDPGLTAEKFCEVHLNGAPVRIYRTGDLGMWGPDGLLEFHGRTDRQLKIRGNRIEPAEIERQIEALLPGVHSCRVVARRDEEAGEHRLLAFCTPRRAQDPLTGGMGVLRNHLAPHQLPSVVVSVDAFPVTDRGKLDEHALLALVPLSEEPEPTLQEDQDEFVRLAAATFSSVLGRRNVTAHASFFELGGSSLNAARVCARVGTQLNRPVPLSCLYEHPTAVSFGARLRAIAADSRAAMTGQTTIPLSPAQLVFLTRHLTAPDDRTGYCLMFWHIEGRLDPVVLEQAIAVVHHSHEPLRAVYTLDPKHEIRVTEIMPPPLELRDEQQSLDLATAELRELFSEPLEPQDADVWRAALVPLTGGEDWLFGLVIHHIAFDGWSESLLARDLSNAYQRRQLDPDKRPSTLVELAAQSAAAARDNSLESRAQLLAGELRDVPELRWPSPPDRGDGPPEHINVPVPSSVLTEIDTAADELGVTRFVVLLAAWAATLSEVCDQRDFALGVPIVQRTAPGLEHAIGCHINTLVIRLRGVALHGDAAGIRETGRLVARAFTRSDLSFAEVAQQLNGSRHRPPVYQSLFALQDNASPELQLPGATTRFLRQPYLDLPLELHAELWPCPEGGLSVHISFRREAVAPSTAAALARGFAERLALIAAGEVS